MKLNNKILAVLVAAAGVSLTGCNIEPELTSSYPQEIAWSNENNLRLNLNGFYSLIAGYYGSEIFDDACTDVLKMNGPNDAENLVVFGISPITSQANPWDNWANRHTWQISCCRFLDDLNKYRANFSPEAAHEAEAEVRFFRALVDFDLAKRFGGCFVLYKTLPPLGEKDHALCTPDEAWNFIAEDLDFAAKYLPDKNEVPLGRLTKGAAYGLKARAMLYAKRWKDASDAALEVKKLGYELYKNPSRPDKGYGELFTNSRTSPVVNNESIIEFGYSYDDKMDYSFDYFYCPPSDGGYAEVSPTENLASEYEMADGRKFSWDDPQMAVSPYQGREPRFYATLLYNGCTWKGQPLYTYEGSMDGYAVGGGTTCTGYYMRKFFDESIPKDQMRATDLTYYFMRYAEILLIYAEAMAEQDEIGLALGALNEVRDRVGLPAVSADNKTDFMRLLRHERMVELAFEGHRFWDIRRWGLGTVLLNDVKMRGVKPVKISDGAFRYEVVNCDGANTRLYLDKYDRFPIPLQELQQNGAIQQFDEWK